MNSIVFAPPFQYGGVKTLYSVCEWLRGAGRCTIRPYGAPSLATWFGHNCELYDTSYLPDVLIYPEVYQPYIGSGRYHICLALGKRGLVQPHADLTVCRSREILNWVKQQHPEMAATLILPSIARSVFEYDGRPKRDTICYMTRLHKHPETAALLRRQYGDKVLEIVDFSEAAVAETLKNSKVFVWRGDDKEGSPRPPKEALVAGCNVVGLESDLRPEYHTNFGVRCSSVEDLIQKAGEALDMPVPSDEERSLVRDTREEKQDWLALFRQLELDSSRAARSSATPLGNRALQSNSVSNARDIVGFPDELSRARWVSQLLSAEAVEKDKIVRQSFEQQMKIDGLVALVAERQSAVESLAAQLAERHEKVLALTEHIAERQRAVESLTQELAESQAKLARSLSVA